MKRSLKSIFPDPDNLLSLSPEELAGVVIELLPDVLQNDMFLMDSFLHPLFPPTGDGYEPRFRRRVILALAETRTWMISHGIIIEDPEQPAAWLCLSRRGKTIRSATDLEVFRKGSLVPRELLQPGLEAKVWPLLLRGDYDVAVFQAFKEVEVAVRNASNRKNASYPDDLVGVPLMRKAFHPETGPLTSLLLVAAEREAEMHLFSGAIGHAKNPTSHRAVVLSTADAARLVVFASHLLDIVERRLT